MVRGASAVGVELVFAEGWTALLETPLKNGEWIVRFSQNDVREFLERHGEMPLPPYIKRPAKNLSDAQTYQTVFARDEGSVAAPTAGFHFTPELLTSLRAQGILTVEVILHVGWGTFRPVRAERVQDHVMLPEHYQVSDQAAAQLNAARKKGRRIIAVGTTSVRTLESDLQSDQVSLILARQPPRIYSSIPAISFKAIDALITNFHLPDSTPLLLACAFYSIQETVSRCARPTRKPSRRATGSIPTATPCSFNETF